MKDNVLKWYEKREKVLSESKEPEKSRSPRGNSTYYKWPHIRAAFLPLMHKHKLDMRSGMQWHEQSSQWVLFMDIIDKETGHVVSDYYTIVNESNSNQGMGSCQTYAKRYMFDNIMGLHFGEDDDDGESGSLAVERGPVMDKHTIDSLFELCNSAGPRKTEAFRIVLNHFKVERLQDIPASRREELRNLIPLIKQLC